MDLETLRQLAKLDEAPAISIFCPFDRRRPGNSHDAAVLQELRDQAVRKLDALLPDAAAAALTTRVDDAIASIDLQHPCDGVAVFVAPNLSSVIPLDAPVGPAVLVGERFDLRELVSAMPPSTRVRVVLLSQERTRCVDLSAGKAVERLDGGFPVEVTPPTEADTPHRDFPLDEHEGAEAVKFVFRAVNHALRVLDAKDAWPRVLVGTERDLAYFDEVSDHRADVVARVHGNHLRDTPDDIASLVRPVLEAHERERRLRTCDEVREAVGSRAVSGIAETWLAARAGRGHQLLVEDGFRFPAQLVGGKPEAAASETDSFDAVTDTIEAVLRHDGEVLVVPSGGLEDLGHVALLTRY